VRALELTTPIAANAGRIFPMVLEELADAQGEALALLDDSECFTYRALATRANQYARWALDQGLVKGDVVGLLMSNRPEYMAIWLGITSVGGVVALLNTQVTGRSLAHCINIVAPKHLIVEAELFDGLTAASGDLTCAARIWVHGATDADVPRIDCAVDRYDDEKPGAASRRSVTIDDNALFIYTSGTTGLPKAARVTHARLMQWTHWCAGMMGTQSNDRMYNCLPMYHSVGGVLATGAVLVAGGAVVIRDGFSARQFWNDVVRWDCTLFQYIGELCRYLLHAEPSANATRHRIRMCCGNGLRVDIWNEFKSRFAIPRILEFYAATEGNVSFFNVEEQPGAVGRIPKYLAHRFPATLIRFDLEKEEPIRDDRGWCIRCAAGEIGEAVGQLLDDPSNVGARFDGYTSTEATDKKILRNAFEPGDAWFRTGDLMRRDARGYFYFVDRIGDTFRWKGENVATTEVSEVICAFPGIKQANVYGVAIPGTEGKAGMATLITDGELDLGAFRLHLIDRLPGYARPLFLRIGNEMDVTTTFKYTKRDLVRQAYNPDATADRIYFDNPERDTFVQLDKALYDRIQAGRLRL